MHVHDSQASRSAYPLRFYEIGIPVLHVTAMDLAHKLERPSGEHLLGTDQFGRDILSRVMKGIEVSFLIGLTAVASGLILGLAIGSVSGYFGGKLDEAVMKVIDTLMAFPGVLLAMMLIAISIARM